MDELTRASQISKLADDIIADPGNPQKATARAHAIKGLAEGIDDAEHEKVRQVLNMRSFSQGVQAMADEVAEEKMAEADNKEAPKPENKAAKAKK